MSNKPEWNPNAKEESLEKYAAWLNNLARRAFVENGGYPDSCFLITEDGRIMGYVLSEEEKAEEVVARESEEIKPFGTIEIMIKPVYHPKLYSQYLRLIEETDIPKDLIRDCLLTRMNSRNGPEKIWASFILGERESARLSDCFVTHPKILT